MSIKAVPLLCLTCIAFPSIATADDSYPHTQQMLKRLDKNGNGTFEKEDNPGQWKRLSKFDKNGDNVLTLAELSVAEKAFARSAKRSLGAAADTKLNVVYKKVDGKDLRLDLYYPKENRVKLSPLIVYTHGGGWAAGSKQGANTGSFAASFKKLLDHGFCVASVDYRLYKKDGKICMRDCVVDCKDAIRYLAKNSDALGVDPNRVYSFGDSAGGHLAQMLLLTTPESLPGDPTLADASYKMLAGVSWYGPCDFEDTQLFNHDDRPDFRDRFGPRILPPGSDKDDKPKLYREMSPVNYLTKTSAPLLMIQGDKDTTIPVKHAYRMKQEAEKLNAPVEVLIIKNAGHNWRKVDAAIEPTRDQIIDRTVAFFVKHAK